MSSEIKRYFVELRTDIADEDDIIATTVLDSSELDDFLDQTTRISFGNMEGGDVIVRDIASVKEITSEEEEILRKFGLIGIETGYFGGIV